ncbi:hypothetical protein E2C01_058226 [Portunus trituberculatus]|uniref:Uncharacterized protein n=1 Tax=Portunus trituberculatus TaxID=210409 RepID=A0A5B7H361_PORTR|nr:hypothetical protein [Portunus trituberculatus]
MRASHGGPSHSLRPSRYGVCVPLISNFLGWRDDRRVESRAAVNSKGASGVPRGTSPAGESFR